MINVLRGQIANYLYELGILKDIRLSFLKILKYIHFLTHQQVVKEDIVLQSKIHPLEKIGLIIIKVPFD